MVLAGETEVLGENLAGRHFVHYKSHLPDLGANPGRCGGKPATNRFSSGAAIIMQYNTRNYYKVIEIFIILKFLKFSPLYDVKYVILSRIVGCVLSSGICRCVIRFWSYSHVMLLLLFFMCVCSCLPEHGAVIEFFSLECAL
jgi:hypothetical protein